MLLAAALERYGGERWRTSTRWWSSDGFDDVIVGSPHAYAGATYAGISYLVLGQASGFSASLNVEGFDTNVSKLVGGDF